MVQFRVDIVANPAKGVSAARQVEGALQKTENSAGRLRKTLNRALTVGAAVLLARRIVDLTDTFTNLQNRLRLVTTDEENLVDVTEELFAISERTRSSFEATADLYARLGIAAKELGRDQSELLQFTESLNKALILSGASSAEAAAGLTQLSQGLASGTLRGDELRSVLEQLPAVADVISQELGITRGELRKLGEQGKITADIILDAFKNAREELDERFATTVPTIGQAFTVLGNKILQTIGALDQGTGASAALSQAILELAEHVEILAIAGASLATIAVGAFGLRGLEKIIAPLVVRIQAIAAAEAAVAVSARAAAAAQAQAAAAAVSSANAYAVGATAARSTAVANVAVAATSQQLARAVLPALIAQIKAVTVALATNPFVLITAGAVAATAAFTSFLSVTREIEEALANTADAATLTPFALLGKQISVLEQELEKLEARGDGSLVPTLGGIQGAITSVDQLRRRIADLREEQAALGQEVKRQSTQQKTFNTTLGETTKKLDDEARLLGFGNREREVQAKLLKEVNRLRKTGGEFLDGQEEQLEATIRRNQSLRDQADILNEIRGPEEDQARRLEAIGEILANNTTLTDEQVAALMRLREETLVGEEVTNSFGASLSETLRELRENFEAAGLGADEFGDAATKAILSALSAAPDLASAISRLNEQFDSGTIKADQYTAVLDQLLGRRDTEDLLIQIERLNELIGEGPADVARYEQALEDLKLQALESSNDLGDGFERAFIKIKREAEDLASVGEDIVNVFADEATNAILEFTETGVFEFKKFANAILDELKRILVRLLVVQALNAVLPGAGTVAGAGAGAIPGLQDGGTTQPGRSFIVGERGPELFTPNRTGSVAPISAGPAEPPQVNVSVVNVADENEVASAIAGGDADDAIVNVIARNRDKVRQVVG